MSKQIQCAAATLIAFTLVSGGSAQAFSLKKLVHGASNVVKGAEKDVGHLATGAAKDVGHVASGAAKDVGHVASGAAKDVGHVASGAAKDASVVGRAAYKEGDKVNKSAGKVVGNVAAKTLDTTGVGPGPGSRRKFRRSLVP